MPESRTQQAAALREAAHRAQAHAFEVCDEIGNYGDLGEGVLALALVAVDVRAIAYWPAKAVRSGTIHLRPPGVQSDHANRRHDSIEHYPFIRLLESIA